MFSKKYQLFNQSHCDPVSKDICHVQSAIRIQDLRLKVDSISPINNTKPAIAVLVVICDVRPLGI